MASWVIEGSGEPLSAQAELDFDQGNAFRMLVLSTFLKGEVAVLNRRLSILLFSRLYISFAYGGCTSFDGINDFLVLDDLPHFRHIGFPIKLNSSLIKDFNDIVQCLHNLWIPRECLKNFFCIFVGQNEFWVYVQGSRGFAKSCISTMSPNGAELLWRIRCQRSTHDGRPA